MALDLFVFGELEWACFWNESSMCGQLMVGIRNFLDFRIAFGQFYPPRAKSVLQILIRKVIHILPFCIKNLAANPMPQPATIWGW